MACINIIEALTIDPGKHNISMIISMNGSKGEYAKSAHKDSGLSQILSGDTTLYAVMYY